MKFRLLPIIVLAAFLLVSLCSCGDTSKVQPSSQSSAVSEVQAETQSAAPMTTPQESPSAQPEVSVEEALSSAYVLPVDDWIWPVEDPNASLSIWYAYPPFFPNYFETADDFPDFAYVQEQTGIDLVFSECTFLNAQENLTLLLASGSYPDLIFNMSSYVTTNLEYAVNESIALDLAALIPEHMPNYSAVFYSNDEYVKRATTDAGYIPAIYQLNDLEANEGINKSGPVIRSDWLEATGLEAPKTYDDYHTVLTALKEYCTYPLWMPFTGAYTAGVFAAGYGVTAETASTRAFINVDGTAVFCPLEDGYREYVEMIRQWYQEGLIDPDFISYNTNANAPTNDQISAEQVAVWSAAANLMDYSNLGNDNVVVQAITDPVQKEGDTTMFGDKTAALGTEVVITTSCADTELALRWCDWWYTEDGYITANYGIEDVSFRYDEEGNPKYTDVILNPSDGMTVNIAQSIYTCGNGMLLCVQDPERAYQWYQPDQIEAEKLWATVDQATCLMPPISMTAEESETFSGHYADIQTYLNEMLPSFIIGAVSMDQWDSFLDNIHTMGIDKCLQIQQDALTRYYAR